jgi:DNA primase
VIPPSFIHDLTARADIVEIVGRHVQLKKAGINYKGLCPFHGEKSPSFIVSPTRQTYHCFGCGAHGNAVGFLMEHLGMGFVDAVKDLAQQCGMTVPEGDDSPEERERARALKEKQTTLTDVLAKAAEHYRKQLKASPRAIDYLKNRGLSGEICARFGMGYAPDGWRGLASVFPRYDDPLLTESGLVIVQGADEGKSEAEQRRYDRFRDRIMFPIRSVQGEVIGFGGRVLDKGEPKYLNSPETPVFVKGRELYGLFEARAAIRASGYVLVVEGYMDVVALAQLGLPNAVATLGTACTAEHVHKLMRHTEQVVFSFDGDAAGRRAAARALEAALPHATDTRSIKFLFLPTEHDPDSYVREFGKDAFEERVEQAVPLSRQFIEHAGEGCDLTTAEGRARLLSQARPLWFALPDGALRRQLLIELASLGRLGENDLQDLWQLTGKVGGAARAQRDADDVSGMPGYGPDDGGYDQPSAADARPAWKPKSEWKGERKGEWKSRQDWKGKKRFAADDAPSTPRPRPSGPADNALRLLLAHSEWWSRISPEDHQLLHELPAPHGEVFTWLERHLENHGAEPWSALRTALAEQDFAGAADRVMSAMAATDEAPFDDLRQVVNKLWLDELKRQGDELIKQAATDPAALQRWREIDARRKTYLPKTPDS